jgi:phenylalanyl-tRNA synthetase beta subunit
MQKRPNRSQRCPSQNEPTEGKKLGIIDLNGRGITRGKKIVTKNEQGESGRGASGIADQVSPTLPDLSLPTTP